MKILKINLLKDEIIITLKLENSQIIRIKTIIID